MVNDSNEFSIQNLEGITQHLKKRSPFTFLSTQNLYLNIK